VLVDPERRIVDSVVVVLGAVEHDGAALERHRIAGVRQVALAEL
jgi:hypothetical protein